MQNRLDELASRRRQLQQRAEAQRQDLGAHFNAIDERFRGFDQGFVKVQGLLQRPALLAGGAALLLFMGPWRALRLAGKAALLLSAARRLFRLV
jgi:hypothetical protein